MRHPAQFPFFRLESRLLKLHSFFETGIETKKLRGITVIETLRRILRSSLIPTPSQQSPHPRNTRISNPASQLPSQLMCGGACDGPLATLTTPCTHYSLPYHNICHTHCTTQTKPARAAMSCPLYHPSTALLHCSLVIPNHSGKYFVLYGVFYPNAP